MELTEKEHKELKRFAQFDKKWRTMYWMGWIIAFFFSLLFIVMGIYIYLQLLPRLNTGQTGFNEDLKMAYSLWCYTFILLGFSAFISGFLMINYCNDVHFLYTLHGRSAAGGESPANEMKPPVKESQDLAPPENKEPRPDAEKPDAEEGAHS
jgi:hypothetical protein